MQLHASPIQTGMTAITIKLPVWGGYGGVVKAHPAFIQNGN